MFKKIGVLLLLLIASLACEKTDPPPQWEERWGDLFEAYAPITDQYAVSTALVDLDQDGKDEIILISKYQGKDTLEIRSYQEGTFVTVYSHEYPNTASSNVLLVGDVYKDASYPEVIVGVSNGLDIYVFNGQFSNPQVIPVNTTKNIDTAIGDFNSDGLVDIAGINSSVVEIRYQTSLGVWDSVSNFSMPLRPVAEIESGDMDGDGKTDLVVLIDQWHYLYVLDQASSFTNLHRQLYWRGTSLGVGNINGDSYDDILMTGGNEYTTPVLQVTYGNASFTYPDSGELVLSGIHDPATVLIGDVNGDGRQDAIYHRTPYGGVSVHLQQPDGSLGAVEHYGTIFTTYWASLHSIAVGDVNGDKLPDIVAASYEQGFGILYGKHKTPE